MAGGAAASLLWPGASVVGLRAWWKLSVDVDREKRWGWPATGLVVGPGGSALVFGCADDGITPAWRNVPLVILAWRIL